MFWGYPAAAFAFTNTIFSFSDEFTVTTLGITLILVTDRYFWELSPNNHRGFILNCFSNSATTFPDNLVRPLSMSAVVVEIPSKWAKSDWVYPKSLRKSVNRLVTISISSFIAQVLISYSQYKYGPI